MIVKSRDAKQREFMGVLLDVLAVGENSMVTRMNYTADNLVPFHQHPHEQTGYVVSGKFRVQFADVDEMLEPGDTHSIPGNTRHSFEVIAAGQVIDFFSPPREDYL
ncbi:MAG: cupin domain-containing protein [Planctomycetota bacterium]|jgi:quercetin dioxygenase-like cupin family protein